MACRFENLFLDIIEHLVNWVTISSDTSVHFDGNYACDTSAGKFTVEIPTITPELITKDRKIIFVDAMGSFGYAITVGSGQDEHTEFPKALIIKKPQETYDEEGEPIYKKLMGEDWNKDLEIHTSNISFGLVYVDETYGWKYCCFCIGPEPVTTY
jgi:hypothetical protein